MNVVLLKDPHDEAMWDHYVLGHPQASGYHTLAWRGVISKVFGHRTYYLMARDEGGVVQGVLPLVLTKSPMFGCFLTSMAFLNYGEYWPIAPMFDLPFWRRRRKRGRGASAGRAETGAGDLPPVGG